MSYVYHRTEPGVYTVGFYRPNGEWEPESDHPTAEAASRRVAYLNGTRTPEPEPKPKEKGTQTNTGNGSQSRRKRNCTFAERL